MGESFSKQIDNFVFLFYPKAWTMPNMSVRHVHPATPNKARNTYPVDKDGRCTHEMINYDSNKRRPKQRHSVRCDAKVTSELKRQAVHEMLGLEHGIPSWFTEVVTFKTANVLTKLSNEWYVRRYNNQYTKGEQRWVFYHDCLKKAEQNTFLKGMFDFIMPYLDRPWACQVCNTPVPNGLQMVSKLTKANIRV